MINYFLPILNIFALSLTIYLTFTFFGKSNWLKTYTQITTFFLLPIITFVIVKVISGNLSLSIGMVGALSIVRFRNPVRSPLELVIYFLMITLGISSSVNIVWGIVLTLSSIFIYLILNIFEFFYKRLLKKSFYIFSHNEMDNNINVIIETSLEINDYNENLSSISTTLGENNTKLLNYNFVFKDKKNSLIFFNEMKEREGTKSIYLQS